MTSTPVWIHKHGLSGLLTRYPVAEGAYDYAISRGFFRPKTPQQLTAKFVGTFSAAAFEHYHYEDGVRDVPHQVP